MKKYCLDFLHGYDWKLPFDPATDIAETIGPREAINRARDKGAKIEYDTYSTFLHLL
ncbi:hypothetical protein KHA80_07205 [Anaerobacillus sp. HL2]|nr:hypothetical protein KHA80_07205 [Anaerobacillus sp. HL2]